MKSDRRTIFQKSIAGRTACLPEKPKNEATAYIAKNLLRAKKAALAEVSELDVVRHFTNLSHLNVSVDSTFYPLGSCTMKYNAKYLEYIAGLSGFASIHPLMAQLNGLEHCTQGALQVIWEAERFLCELTGMKAFTLQPMAGAHGEFTGAMLIAAYHKKKGNKKTKIIVPDASHGTNPATAALAGYEVVSILSKDGIVDPEALEAALDDEVAAVMMTCPNTLGLFETHLPQVVEKLNRIDALLYYDGANMNAIMGEMRVGDVGFDVVHLNLHKTMGTPHGGGGPGSGPVGVSARLEEFLPISRVEKKEDGSFYLDYDRPYSIGYIAPFYGNFAVFLKAYAYMVRLGGDGLNRASQYAVLNANYMKEMLKDVLQVPYPRICMHEFVASPPEGYTAFDIAKALLEAGYHAPTVYFPLIVKECLMFEPTETESKQTLDMFIATMKDILSKTSEELHEYPLTTPVRRLDETLAARNMILTEQD